MFKVSSLLSAFLMLLLSLSLLLPACSDDSGDDDDDTTSDGDEDGDQTDDDDDDVDNDDSDGDDEIVKEPLPFEPAGPDSAPDPMALGPFPVGVKTFTFNDPERTTELTGEPRRLVTEIWYPAVQDTRDMETWIYELQAEAEDEQLGDARDKVLATDIEGLPSIAVRDAEIARSHGPFPVILFSHGSNGIRWQSLFYTEHLASHGYIVISTDHEGNTLWDLFRDGWNSLTVGASALPRVQDMTYLLDRAFEFNQDPEDFFYQMMDEELVAATGHSFGGFTSIAAPCNDPRIKVSVPHSPVISMAMLFGCDLDAYNVPIMVMGGTKDNTLNWKDQYCDYRMIQGVPKYLYELENGGHFTFSEMCALDLVRMAEDLDFGDAANALTDGCSETENAPVDDSHNSTNYYATAFLNYHLRGSTASLDYLVDKDESPFELVNFYEGDIPNWTGDEEGCNE